jgi:subtilisin family serine protease
VQRRQLLDDLARALAARGGGEGVDGELARLGALAREEFAAAACSVAVLDGDRLRYLAAAGAGADAIVGTELSTDRGIGGYVAQTGQALAIDRPAADARFARDVADRTGYLPEALLVLPILDPGGEVLGILTVLDGRTDPSDVVAPDHLPAWSERFLRGRPGPAPLLSLPGPVTREWAYGDGRGRGVRVAVIDSGIDADHPDVGGVAGSMTLHADDGGGVHIVAEPHEDLYGHGTACAGLIRALAPEVELTSVRVLGPNLRGSAPVFAAALAWCIEERFDIVNLSLSTSNPAYLGEFWGLLDRAAFARVLLVAAMNNERKRTIPSELAGVCSVACGPGQDLERVWCSPVGPPEWAAAGLDLPVAWRGGTRVVASGNSFSTAVVSGHLARVCAAHPGIAPWQARTVLAAVAVNAGRD